MCSGALAVSADCQSHEDGELKWCYYLFIMWGNSWLYWAIAQKKEKCEKKERTRRKDKKAGRKVERDIQETWARTAVVVADDDDVAHFEVVHRVLDAGQAVQVPVADQVADVAVHKDVSRRLVEDQVGLRARTRYKGGISLTFLDCKATCCHCRNR